MRARRIAVISTLAAALLLALLSSLAIGSGDAGPSSVIGALLAFDGSNDQIVIRDLRLPRTIVGLAVGVALGVAGAVIQAVTRNPLAEPGILGINAGAALAVVIGIAAFGIVDPTGYVWFALAGAALTALGVMALGAVGARGATPIKLVIGGAVLAAMLASITSAFLVIDESTLDVYRFWIVGSIAGRSLDVVAVAGLPIVVGAVIGIHASRALNALALGDDVARSLGLRVGVIRGVALTSTILLAGGAVALAGPIVFVGLAVPHAARALVGPDWRFIVPLSAVIGPVLLLGADVIGRVVARPGELQVGVVTALIGAPLFIVLVRRQRLAEL